MILEVNDLTYSHHKQSILALDKVHFTLNQSSINCLLGPNGSGKTTLLKLLAGLIRSQKIHGKISWNFDNHTLNPLTANPILIAQNIGYLPSKFNIAHSVSVFDFLAQGFFAVTSNWSQTTKEQKILLKEKMLEHSIGELSERELETLSTGELQQVLFLRATLNQPKALLLDEPFSNLDLSRQYWMLQKLTELQKSGVTILIASHDINLGLEFCDQFLWMKSGSITGVCTEKTFSLELAEKNFELPHGQFKLGTNPFSNRPQLFLNHSQ